MGEWLNVRSVYPKVLINLSQTISVVDKKIKGLDNELRGFKEQMKKAKGPTLNHIKKRAMDTLKRKVLHC
jgi:hypothetical protein